MAAADTMKRAVAREEQARASLEAASSAKAKARMAALDSQRRALEFEKASADLREAEAQYHENSVASLMREGDSLKALATADQAIEESNASLLDLQRRKIAVARDAAILDAILPEHERRKAAMHLGLADIASGELSSMVQLNKRADLACVRDNLVPMLRTLETASAKNKAVKTDLEKRDKALSRREENTSDRETDLTARSDALKKREATFDSERKLWRALRPHLQVLKKLRNDPRVLQVPGLASVLVAISSILTPAKQSTGRER